MLRGQQSLRTFHALMLTKLLTRSTIYGNYCMDLSDLVRSILRGDLLMARQWVADAHRAALRWEAVQFPGDLDPRELIVAAAIAEMLAERNGARPPAWAS